MHLHTILHDCMFPPSSDALGWLLHHSWSGVSGPRPGNSNQLQSGENLCFWFYVLLWYTWYNESLLKRVLGMLKVKTHESYPLLAFCCPWNPVGVWWGHVILSLSPIQRILVAFQGPGGERLGFRHISFQQCNTEYVVVLTVMHQTNQILRSTRARATILEYL